MQYIIMILIVIGLALSDIVTGWIKAHVNNDYCSAVMRKGGLNKFGEIVIMLTACGLEIGMKLLGNYYDCEELSKLAGAITAISIFLYIVVMELISIIENYGEANPDAVLPKVIGKRLRGLQNSGGSEEERNEKGN